MRIIGLVTIPVVLLLLPNDFFDSGQSLCLSKVLLDFKCLGCGITRGIQHLIHFDFQIAWDYNKLAYPVFLVGIYLWLKLIIKTYKEINSSSDNSK